MKNILILMAISGSVLLGYSFNLHEYLLAADEAEVQRRAAAIGREPDELRANGVAGTPDEVRASLARWRGAGAERVYLQMLDLSDLDHLDLVAGIIAN